MALEALTFIGNATLKDINSISDIEQAVSVKLRQLRDAEKSLALVRHFQNTIKGKDSIAKSITIIAARKWEYNSLTSLQPHLHFTVGYSANSLLETLDFFEGNIGSEVAAFADSFVEVKIYQNKTVYSNHVNSFDIFHQKKQQESKRTLLETFPIFSLCTNFAENFEQILQELDLDEVEMPSADWPFFGWSLEQNRAIFESNFDHYRKSGHLHSFFHDHLGIMIQKRFAKYWGYAEDSMPDDSDFEDHLGNEWNAFQKMISQIENEQWFQMWAMNKRRLPVPGGDFHQYWLPKLDPNKVFFRRKRKGKKRKFRSV